MVKKMVESMQTIIDTTHANAHLLEFSFTLVSFVGVIIVFFFNKMSSKIDRFEFENWKTTSKQEIESIKAENKQAMNSFNVSLNELNIRLDGKLDVIRDSMQKDNAIMMSDNSAIRASLHELRNQLSSKEVALASLMAHLENKK